MIDLLSLSILESLQVLLVIVVGTWMVWRLVRTPARNPALGAALVGAVYLAFKLIGLDILANILGQILGLSAVAGIVIFAPEIRKFLGRIGGQFAQFGSRTFGDMDMSALDEMCDCLTHLSDRKVGALVVIERAVGLDEVAATGHIWDARIGEALIETIFDPTSPVHDGSVLVRRGRVHAVATILPLYDGPHPLLIRSGTRHRAALGIASETDAVAVVVSEETGRITVAMGGAMRHVHPTELRKTLLQAIIAAEPSDPSSQRLVDKMLRRLANLMRHRDQ